MPTNRTVKRLIEECTKRAGKKKGCVLCQLTGQQAKDLETVMVARRDEGLIHRHAREVLNKLGIQVCENFWITHYNEHWDGKTKPKHSG